MTVPRSSILRTRGIAIRVSPFSRTSHVVTWLTEDRGKLTTLVKGAQRPRSLFLGQYDVYYSCDVLFYGRDREGAHILRECNPYRTRPGLRSAWRAAVCASYACDLSGHLVPANQPNPAMHALLERTLDRLEAEAPGPALLCWFELRALEAAGLAPQLRRCGDCGRDLAAAPEGARFAVGRGAILCGACPARPGEAAPPISPGAVAFLHAWTSGEEPPPGTGSAPACVEQIRGLLERFLDYHVRPHASSRTIAFQLVG